MSTERAKREHSAAKESVLKCSYGPNCFDILCKILLPAKFIGKNIS